MDKLPMCRICLVQNVRMFVVVNRNLRELYEKLTDIQFVTEDCRPILACFICCTKLKQCYRLLRQCLEAEELFALMMNEDNEPLVNKDHFEFYSGFIKSPIVHISLVNECQTECIAIKEETLAACEGLDDNYEPKEEYQSDELELGNFDYSACLDEPLIEFKTEVQEEQEIFKNEIKQRARATTNAPAAEKPKLDTRRIKIQKAITTEQKKHELANSEMNQNTQHRTSTPVTKYKHSFTDIKEGVSNRFSKEGTWTERIRIHTGEKRHKCAICQRFFSRKSHLTRHIRKHTGEKPNKCEVCQRSFSQLCNLKRHSRIHTDDKPYKCDLCQRSFNDKRDLSKHIHVHNGEKPFKCDICQLSFNDRRDIIKHIRKHTGEKPFKCDICQRSFSYSCDFKKHVRVHTGEKPYTCEVCQRSFNTKSNLKKHSFTHC